MGVFMRAGHEKLFDLIEQSGKSVLAAFMRINHGFAEQIASLREVYGDFANQLDVCLVDESSLPMVEKRFTIMGTPTYLLFRNGKELGRYLGYARPEALREFVGKHIGGA
jgi:thioredoxin-like negative regulator of GroEL